MAECMEPAAQANATASESVESAAKRAKTEEEPKVKAEESTATSEGSDLQRTIPWVESFAARQAAALHEHGREKMIDAIFDAWDRDGNGSLSFEEILPHYMKCAHHNVMEPEVRTGFEHFMVAQGRKPSEGITPDLFRSWLSKLNDEQIASHYVRHVQGWTSEPYRMNFDLAVVKEYHHKTLKEILDSPIHALRGLSELAEDALAPLGLHTVRDIGGWRCFVLARAICTLAARETTETDRPHEMPSRHVNIRNALTKEHEAATLKHVLDLPVSALSMFPEQGTAALQHINIRTIRHLGMRKYFHWANAMLELEHFEA